MPRNISFSMTADQIRNQTKTVTRRLGWKFLKPGDLLQPVVKGMGLKKGEHVEKIGGLIRVVSIRLELLSDIKLYPNRTPGLSGWWTGNVEIIREGFPKMHYKEFIEMFCKANQCKPDTVVTRIEFEYVMPQSGSDE